MHDFLPFHPIQLTKSQVQSSNPGMVPPMLEEARLCQAKREGEPQQRMTRFEYRPEALGAR